MILEQPIYVYIGLRVKITDKRQIAYSMINLNNVPLFR